jgi:general stress protein 26
MNRQAIAIVLLLLSVAPAMVLAALTPEMNAVLKDADLIYVATARKSGSRSKAAPIWFAVIDDAIWINTGATSAKVKRVKRGSPMWFATKQDGPFVEAKAEIVTDGASADRLGEVYRQKYWIAWLGFFRPNAARVASGKTVLIKLTPK